LVSSNKRFIINRIYSLLLLLIFAVSQISFGVTQWSEFQDIDSHDSKENAEQLQTNHSESPAPSPLPFEPVIDENEVWESLDESRDQFDYIDSLEKLAFFQKAYFGIQESRFQDRFAVLESRLSIPLYILNHTFKNPLS